MSNICVSICICIMIYMYAYMCRYRCTIYMYIQMCTYRQYKYMRFDTYTDIIYIYICTDTYNIYIYILYVYIYIYAYMMHTLFNVVVLYLLQASDAPSIAHHLNPFGAHDHRPATTTSSPICWTHMIHIECRNICEIGCQYLIDMGPH